MWHYTDEIRTYGIYVCAVCTDGPALEMTERQDVCRCGRICILFSVSYLRSLDSRASPRVKQRLAAQQLA